jgi:glycosyltransferase involved in cell wall biosynthesis
MSSADISIVTPSLNQGVFIEQTILSVLSQAGVTVQYIVVDGGSTDSTRGILERYRNRLDRLIVEPDHGQADAIRKGFSLATGEFCGYLNSDDYLLPDALERAVRFLRANSGVDAVYGDRIYVDEQDRLLRYWRLPRHFDYINCRWDFIPQEACFWRRAVMEEVGGIDDSYRFAVDYDLFARMMKQGKHFVHLGEFFAVFREHPRSKTSANWESTGAPEMVRVREQYGFEVKPHQMIPAALHYAWLSARSGWFKWRYPGGPPAFVARMRCQAAATAGTECDPDGGTPGSSKRRCRHKEIRGRSRPAGED